MIVTYDGSSCWCTVEEIRLVCSILTWQFVYYNNDSAIFLQVSKQRPIFCRLLKNLSSKWNKRVLRRRRVLRTMISIMPCLGVVAPGLSLWHIRIKMIFFVLVMARQINVLLCTSKGSMYVVVHMCQYSFFCPVFVFVVAIKRMLNHMCPQLVCNSTSPINACCC